MSVECLKFDGNCTDDTLIKLRMQRRRRLLWIPLVVICATLLYSIDMREELHYQISLPHNIISIPEKPFPKVKSGFVVDTEGCRIPDLDPFDPVVQKFIEKEKPLNCSEKHPLLVDANRTSLFIVKSSLPAFNISDMDQLECCYQPFWRPKENISGNNVDNTIIYADNCTSFKPDVNIEDEFVKVICKVDNEEIYKTYHGFVHLKPNVEQHCEEALQKLSTKKTDRLSVLVVGIDSVSRLNFHRQMPKTAKLLKELDAIELLGYNKVADNTFPNLIAILSGHSEQELHDKCWPTTGSVFDNCNWIWKNYSDVGYRTAFAEDDASMGVFNWGGKGGFVVQPTDYYTRPFLKISEDDIGHKQRMYSKPCLGSQMSVAVLLKYLMDFAITMKSKDSFGFWWESSLSHDFLNTPSLGDDLHVKLLNQLIDLNAIDKSVLIVMSDHGIRWGDIRETYQGRIEERLPFVYFVFPDWFKSLYPTAIANLNKNTDRLTCPFDIHEMLLDILDLQQLEQKSIQKRTKELDELNSKPRGISLFLPVPKSRTCNESGISPHWCTCQESESVSVDVPTIKNMSLILVKHLNSLLKPYRECSHLELAEVKSASVGYPLEHLYEKTKDQGIRDYVLVVRTTPGDAIFEGTVRHHVGSSNIKVTGGVSRLNSYGSQSACVTDFHMKPYCYCITYEKIRTTS